MNKIYFKKVRSKNFRSFGNQFIEIDLTQKSTLVCSDDNGAGKSTGIVHALAFALFDTPYQNKQKKGGLVNTRNGKDCVVEVEFDAKGSTWEISRGIKPNFLKIIKDGVPVENEASLKDPQKYLEETVLGFNEKIFFNIALLGRDKFVSFAEMTAGEMRGFVEVLLDQGIFSVMNDVAKVDLKETNRKIDDISADIRNTAVKMASSSRVIGLLETTLQEKKKFSKSLVDEVSAEIATLKIKIYDKESEKPPLEADVVKWTSVIQEEIKTRSMIDAKIVNLSVSVARDAVNRVTLLAGQFDNKVSTTESQRAAFMSKTSCPSCEQPIADSKKHEYCARVDPELEALKKARIELQVKVDSAKELLTKKEIELSTLQQERNNFKTSDSELQEAKSKVDAVNNALRSLRQQESQCVQRKLTLEASSDSSKEEQDIVAETKTLADLRAVSSELDEKEKQIHIHRNTIQSLLVFLRDDGVKGKIASQYLPFLNQKTNEYLDALNLWVNIEFDNEFGVSMSAPDRKGQTIADLSTGQMRRIDVAVLLAWRDIAKLKASVDTNILIMDETLENLSAQGVAEFVDMFGVKCADTSLFVMTQRNQEFSEFFDRTLHFSLKDGFSVMKEES